MGDIETTVLQETIAFMLLVGLDTGGKVRPALLDQRGILVKNLLHQGGK
jgi:hypothetical protein